MRITGVTTRVLDVDGQERFGGRAPRGRPQRWKYPLTTIHTDEGVDGSCTGYGTHGEGGSLGYLVRDVFSSFLVGADPLQHQRIWRLLMAECRHLYALTEALVGVIDVALWDIKGKVARQPIATLLGGARGSVPAYASAWSFRPTPEEVAAEAADVRRRGFHGYKLQMWDGPAVDIPRLAAAAEAVPDGFALMLDACGGYDYPAAVKVGRELDARGFRWFEEPLPDSHLERLRALSEQLQTPVVGAETAPLSALPAYLRAGSVDVVRADTYLKAGITGLTRAVAACELFGFPLEIHTAASPLLDAANLHVACGTGASTFAEVHHPVYRFGMVGDPLGPDPAGYLHAPSGPGLGIPLDWDWIDNHTVEVVTS